MRKDLYKFLLFIFSTLAYNSYSQTSSFDVEGHRGCRGLYPENTIPAFINAVQLKVNTLELDVVISRDQQVVVSHEPWINNEICLDKSGEQLTLASEKQLNIYAMDYSAIREHDCGSKFYGRFPEQVKMFAVKPLLSEVFDSVLAFCRLNSLDIPDFNIEIKSDPEYDSIYSPTVNEFCELVIMEIKRSSLLSKCMIQSFDSRALKYIHQKYQEVKLVYLTESLSNVNDVKKVLGFLPSVFSPDKRLVTKKNIQSFHAVNVKVIPWTVNEEKQIARLIALGVDGIISDYPDRVLKLLKKQY